MDATETFDLFGQTVTGTFRGSTNASSKLFGRDSITVRGTTYPNAVKGTVTLVLSGDLKLNAGGVKVTAPTKITETQTFWAVPGVGIVKLKDDFTIDVTPPGQDTSKAKLTSTSDLVSYVLPS